MVEGIAQPRLMYWRIVLVGWGTVIGVGLIMVVAMFLSSGGLPPLTFVILAAIYGTVISAILTVPMLVIWVPIFATFRTKARSLRKAATLTTAIVSAISTVIVSLGIGLLERGVSVGLTFVLPFAPAAVGISTCLAWHSFGATETLGTR